ncbi:MULTISPECIES: hypothetical protein [unclassified Ruegeria]|uniref:hypothetical protein n=1 Tax=unclassified Ruegeria TaxID=2625375 RepID=UPI001488A7D4|nr:MULTISPECIES: hypothetical protein [unclassified Ruegeria]NOD65573.1 hypothetical protein [Ruegeria sp. HKCCD6109]
MGMNVSAPTDKLFGKSGAVLLILAVIFTCLAVLLINGAPLYYFDTGSYIRQGSVALNMLLPPGAEGGTPGVTQTADGDSTASGSRSLIYGMILAGFFRANALFLVPVLHLSVVLLVAWLLARNAHRSMGNAQSTTILTTVPLLVAASTSLPFYIAYMMPDIFAPVLLIIIAALAAFGRTMQIWEVLLMSGGALLCVLVHPSHFAIAGLMISFLILAALGNKMPRGWRATVLMIVVLVLAAAERKAFHVTVETTTKKEVIYTPHITARLIVDGPGMAYLDEACPDAEIPTCALHEALSWSDDPYRMTPSHIIFERSARLGSFRLLPPEDQKQIALSQRDFAKAVFLSHPFSTSLALAKNGYQQILRHSITMTIPTDVELNNARRLARLSEVDQDMLQMGQLSKDRAWIGTIDALHSAIYAISFVLIAFVLLKPASVAPDMKLFALFILIGIAVNALVCGGVSQPADRYGARVMWLLPFTAAFLFLVQRSGASRILTGDPS